MLLKKIWDFMGSRNLSVFIFVMATIYVLILLIFAFLIPVWWIGNIASLLPYKVLYALFFINLIVCEIKWIPVVVRQCRRAQLPESEEEVEKFRHRIEARSQHLEGHKESEVRSLGGYLKGRGYKVVLSGNKKTLLYATKGRFSPIGNLIFHTSFFFLLSGVLISLFFRFEGTVMLTEGYPFTGNRGEYKGISAAPLAALPKISFSLKNISASFWKENIFFTDLVANISHSGGDETVRLSSPARIKGANVTISGYGYSPMYELKGRDGKVIDRGYVVLNIFLPGSEDHFSIPGFPHQIFVKFFPDYEERGGKLGSRSMNPVNPAYSVRIFRGRLPVYTGVVKQGEWADFDGLSISFPSFIRWGDFKIVRNPGHPFIWTALVMMVFGLVWKLLFYKRELLLWEDAAGKMFLSGRFDYYQKLNVSWLKRLARKFGEVTE